MSKSLEDYLENPLGSSSCNDFALEEFMEGDSWGIIELITCKILGEIPARISDRMPKAISAEIFEEIFRKNPEIISRVPEKNPESILGGIHGGICGVISVVILEEVVLV